MLIRKIDEKLVVRLEKGEKVIENIEEMARTEGLKGAFFYGLGGVMWADIGFYNLDEKEYSYLRIDELMELTNITGNIAVNDNEILVHAHASLGKSDYSLVGGHLKEAEVAGTVELIILQTNDLSRIFDDEIGLKLLDL